MKSLVKIAVVLQLLVLPKLGLMVKNLWYKKSKAGSWEFPHHVTQNSPTKKIRVQKNFSRYNDQNSNDLVVADYTSDRYSITTLF